MTTRAQPPVSGWREEWLFLITNRIPRHAASRLMGWLSSIESPLLARAALALWRRFDGDFRLHEAEQQSFSSIHAIFTRRLKPGVRPLDPRAEVALSPCDAFVGEYGIIEAGRAYQAKGFPYQLEELLGDAGLARRYEGGIFVTLRLKSSMYHRFHAPLDCHIDRLVYISGDRWNVHPPALRRIDRLYCRNERAIIECQPSAAGNPICLVAVAAVLVSSIRIHGVDTRPAAHHGRPRTYTLRRRPARGEELGWFEHGSTIIVLAQPGLRLARPLAQGRRVFMGQALLEPAHATTANETATETETEMPAHEGGR
jgi:phosphatidylserine decarboxylase